MNHHNFSEIIKSVDNILIVSCLYLLAAIYLINYGDISRYAPLYFIAILTFGFFAVNLKLKRLRDSLWNN